MESIGYIFFIIAAISFFVAIIADFLNADNVHIISAIIAAFSVIAGIVGCAKGRTTSEQDAKYSSKEYHLEYQITTFRGQTDTVYVLTKKELD